MTGWWLTYSSEKWWTTRQLGWLFHSQLDGKSEYIHVPNHQPAMDNGRLSHWNISRLKGYFHNCLKMMCVCVWNPSNGTPVWCSSRCPSNFNPSPGTSKLPAFWAGCCWIACGFPWWFVSGLSGFTWFYHFYVTYRQWSTKWLSWDDDSQYMEK